MKFTEQEIQQTYNELNQTASPWGALVGALMGSIPAIAMYAFFVHIGGILYVFLLIPPAMIGFAAQFTGRVYRVEHRIPVAVIACLVYSASIHYFNYRGWLYFLTPIVFTTALVTAKRRLNQIQDWVVDMQAEGRFEQQ